MQIILWENANYTCLYVCTNWIVNKKRIFLGTTVIKELIIRFNLVTPKKETNTQIK